MSRMLAILLLIIGVSAPYVVAQEILLNPHVTPQEVDRVLNRDVVPVLPALPFAVPNSTTQPQPGTVPYCPPPAHERALTVGEHLELLHSGIRSLMQQLGSADQGQTETQEGITSIRTLIGQLTTSVKSLEQQIATIEKNAEIVAAERKQIDVVLTRIEQSITVAAKKRDAQNHVVAQLTPKIANITKQLNALATNDDLKTAQSAAQKLDLAARSRTQALENRMKTLATQESLLTTTKRIDSLITKIDSLKEEAPKPAPANDKVSTQLQQLIKATEQSTKQRDSHDATLNAILARLDRLETSSKREGSDDSKSSKTVRPSTKDVAVPREIRDAGLRWIVDHQFAKGHWSFHHGDAPKARSKSLQGQFKAHHAATGLALLTLMEYGHTTREGEHRDRVRRGVDFLLRDATRGKGNLEDDGNARHYGQAIGTLALLRANAVSPSKELQRAIQMCVDRIVKSQHRKTGGWGYQSRDRSTTPITSWHIEALAAARDADFEVPAGAMLRADHFLESMMTSDGRSYGYDRPEDRRTTTAAALDSRMIIGWSPVHPGLQAPTWAMSKSGPSRDNFYYNFYATRLLARMHHVQWKKWRDKLTRELTSQQQKKGRDRGAWTSNRDDGAQAAGMLYNTTFALLTLKTLHASP